MVNMYEKMAKLDKKRNPLFTAVSTLTTPESMRAFVRDAINHYKKNGETSEIKQNAESIVKSNLGYIVGYYDKKVAKNWMDTIDGIIHPVFGKNIPFNNPDNAYYLGKR